MLSGLLTHVLYSFDKIIQLMISTEHRSCKGTKFIFFPIRMAKNKPRKLLLTNPPEMTVCIRLHKLIYCSRIQRVKREEKHQQLIIYFLAVWLMRSLLASTYGEEGGGVDILMSSDIFFRFYLLYTNMIYIFLCLLYFIVTI